MAVFVNYAWELAQGPLYADAVHHAGVCALASDFFDGMTMTTINVKIEKNKPSTPHNNALRPWCQR